MSQETNQWHRENEMIGFCKDKSKWEGNLYVSFGEEVKPWWSTDNEGLMMYEGGIPVDDIRKKLFNFRIESSPLWFPVYVDDVSQADGVDDDGRPYKIVKCDDWQVIHHGDTLEVFSVATDKMVTDQYERTLLESAATILSVAQNELEIGSAQKLRGGAVAAITLELPELIETPSGYNFRPKMTLVDSYNKQFAFGIYYAKYIPICDNGLLDITRSSQVTYTRKHTSTLNVAEARNAMGIMFKNTDEFMAEIEALANYEVSDVEFMKTLHELVPIPDEVIGPKGNVTNQSAITRRENKHEMLEQLWMFDNRCADWHGTALGAVQSWNTFHSHLTTVRRSQDENGFVLPPNRAERNMLDLFRGKQLDRDSEFVETLVKVCDRELVLN